MKRKFISMLSIICFVLGVYSFAFAENNDNYELKLFLGESINLKTYVQANNVPIIIDDLTVVQNMNASIMTINASRVINTQAIGRGLLVVSRDSKTVRINITVESPIETVSFNMKNLVLYVGEIQYLDYTVLPKEGYTGKMALDLTWESAKSGVATVVEDNRVVTHAAGTTKLTARDQSGEIVTTFEVRVLGHSNKLSVTSSNRIRRINVGETLALTARLGSKDVTNNIYWESLTPHVLKVDKYGVITAVGEGIGRIRAQSTVTNNHFDYEINAYSMIDKVLLNKTTIKFMSLGATEQLYFNLYPKDINNPPLLTGYEYKTSNPDVATVSEAGLVTAIGPGIALVSVVFEDNQTTASCTVEVSDSIDLENVNTMPIKKIDLKSYAGVAMVGQKIPLTYTVEPKDASHQLVTFDVLGGDQNQIQMIDGDYYFIPSKRGNISIEVKADNGVKDTIMIPVTSAIDELKLSLSTYRLIDTNEERLYTGETVEVLTRIYTKHGYEKGDVYPVSLNYSVKDPDVLDLIAEGDRYYVKALKPGNTKITVTNLEGLHEETLWVNVADPITSFSTDSGVTLPVDKMFKPRLNMTYQSMKDTLNQPLDFKDSVKLSVKNFYLAETIIDDELAYENFMVNQYGDGPFDLNTRDLVEMHQTRLAQFKALKSKVVGGYVLLTDPSSLMDRNNRSYKFYTIKGDRIVAYYPSKMTVGLEIKNTPYKAETSMTWLEDDTVFEIQRLNNTYTLAMLIDQYQLGTLLDNLDREVQVDLLMTYINNRNLFTNTPTYDLLRSVHEVIENGLFPSSIDDLSVKMTKNDLVILAGQLHKKYVDTYWERNYHDVSYYYDVVGGDLRKALALNYVNPTSRYYFGTSEFIKEGDVHQVISRVLPNYIAPASLSTKDLTGEQLMLLLANAIQ